MIMFVLFDVLFVVVGVMFYGMLLSIFAGARVKSFVVLFACNVVGYIVCCGIFIVMDMIIFIVLLKSSVLCILFIVCFVFVCDMKYTYSLFDVSRFFLFGC